MRERAKASAEFRENLLPLRFGRNRPLIKVLAVHFTFLQLQEAMAFVALMLNHTMVFKAWTVTVCRFVAKKQKLRCNVPRYQLACPFLKLLNLP